MLEGLTLSSLVAAGLALSAGAAFLWAAVSDLGAYRIPNSCVLLILLLFPVFSFLAGSGAPLLPHAIAGGAVLALGVPLYAFGLAGAGDFKLLAAAALWAGPQALPALLMVMAISGGLLASAWWLRGKLRLRIAGNAPSPDDESGREAAAGGATNLPYGVAISAGALVVLTQQLQALVA
jgi:prepilin peptidase CpaA